LSDTHHDALNITNNAIIGGTLAVTGASALTGNVSIGGTLATTGAYTPTGGITVGTNKKIQFRDGDIYINSSADGQLDIVSDGKVQIATAALDINCDSDITVDSGAGSDITVTVGDQGTADTAGGGMSFTAGKGKGTGAGGDFKATGGAAEAASNADGGDVELTPGAGDGGGSDGQVKVEGHALVNTDKEIRFRDSAIHIKSADDGHLDITADESIDLNGDVEVTGCVDVSGDIVVSAIAEADRFVSAQMCWCDDFMEAAAALASTVYSKAHWTGAGTNGTQAIVAGLNGVMRLATTATGSSDSTLTYNGSGTFDNDKKWVWEARLLLDNITNTKINMGMYVDDNDHIMFEFDTATDAANIYLRTDNNNADPHQQDTGIDLTAGNLFTFTIEVADDDTFEVFINGTQVCETPDGTIRDVAFKPYFYVDNKAAAEDKHLDIDYCKVWQDR